MSGASTGYIVLNNHVIKMTRPNRVIIASFLKRKMRVMTAGLKIWCFIHKNLRKWYKQKTLPQDSFIQPKYAWWHLVVSDSVNLHTIPILLHQSFTKNCKVKNKSQNHKSRRRYRFKVTKVKICYGKNCESQKQKKPSLQPLIA